jgi:hypothetical protein
MSQDVNILSPCGMLGYGFPEESFRRGMEQQVHAVVVDAGSTDGGPHKLGAGVSIVSRRACKKALEIILGACLPGKVPVIIGSAGGSGARPHVESGGSLEIVFDRITNVESSKIYYKPYYRREDFNDEKYKPTFAPQVYSGQTVEFKLRLDQWEGAPLRITPYVRDTYTKEEVLLEDVELVRGEWNTLSFVVPPLAGSFADEVGFMIDSPTSTAASRAFGALYIGRMRVYGGGGYAIDWRKQAVEFTSVTPMAQHRGEWSLKDGALHYAVEGNAAAFTGNDYARDVEAEAEFTPLSGESHGFVARALGIERCYWLGLAEEGTVSIRKNDFGWTELASASFPWEHGRTYALKMIVRGASLKLYVDDKLVVEAEDAQYAHGMYGVASLRDAAGSVGEFRVISFTVQDGMER